MMSPRLAPFTDVGMLRRLLDSGDLDAVVCDCRAYLDEREGIDAYRAGHIPGARFIDLGTVVSGPVESGSGKGRHPLPDSAVFADSLGRAGIGHNSTVVAYDDVGGAIAARLVWMLRAVGQDASVLDGGLGAWGEPLETGESRVEPVEHNERPFPRNAFVSAGDVAAVIERDGLVVDSRGADRYAGLVEPIDRIAGHIPGAINLPFVENLDDGRVRPIDDLTTRFEAAGVNADTVFYCGSGVTACHNLLAVEASGLGRAKLYVGSWSGWIDRVDPSISTAG